MDFFSGSVPRKLIPFRLRMSGEHGEKITQGNSASSSGANLTGEKIPPPGESALTNNPEQNPLSQSSNSSGEDVNQYASNFLNRHSFVCDNLPNPPSKNVSLNLSSSPIISGKSRKSRNLFGELPVDIWTCPRTSSPKSTPRLPVPPPTKWSISASFFRDTDSDVISLGECTNLPVTSLPKMDTYYGVKATIGESGLSVLYKGDTAGKRYLDSGGSDNDTDQFSLGRPQETQYLNSLDPYPELRRLTGPSRSLLKRYFEENVPVSLSKDHTTVAFSQDQVYNLIRVACDETAHTSFEMMTGLLRKASELPGKFPSNPSTSASRTKPRGRSLTPARQFSDATSDEGGGGIGR